ncbi:SH3KBP1-binding protein 1 [Dinochytrium kinnereticum]|nr:SH3KBP1-binding protein 1 [Dinochytrium kinnereticum]
MRVSARIDLEAPIDGLFFIGSSLIVLSKVGRVGFWNPFTQSWLVKDITGISSFDTSGSLLFLGRTDGRISYINIEKFPLRLSDDSLLVNDFFQSPSPIAVTSLSVYLTPFSSASPDTFIELAYGSSDGTVRIVIEHPQSVGRSPMLFQTLAVHTKAVSKVRLGEKSLISVCENENHVRTWKIHRFRGRLSTQPGTVPISSFRIPATDLKSNNIGPYGGSDTPEVFVYRNQTCPDQLNVVKSFSGARVCSVTSIDGTQITSYQVLESDHPSRLGSRPRRLLVSGHSNGQIQMWDLLTALESFHNDERPRRVHTKQLSSVSSATETAD